MLLLSSFAGERFRVGGFAMGWLFATALLIGLGLGPVIAYFESALTQAFARTAATVAGAGALGFAGACASTAPRPTRCGFATGIFVSIVNIFLSLLNIFSSR